MSYINYFNFNKFNDSHYLLTNDAGRHIFLSEDEFQDFINEKETMDLALLEQLQERGFMTRGNRELFVEKVAQNVREYKDNLFGGPCLHIFVVTTKCNQRCAYCQASVSDDGLMMDKETARKAVDLALQSPATYMSFEFQGGEPLINFEVIKYIVEYTESLENEKCIEYNVVSNLTLLTDEMLDFFKEHHVNISTSLDGDKSLHCLNRPFKDNSQYEDIIENIHKANGVLERKVGAIQTTTQKSLKKYKDIIDQYVSCGMNSIFLRPLTPLGFAGKNWDKIGYTPEEFLAFYKKSLEYIVQLNLQGVEILEGHAMIFLRKILGLRAGNYTELCSPCGAVRGQLAYYCDGNIYTCDEGRMLAEMGNDAFKVGTVDSEYKDIMTGEVCKTVCVASCLEAVPACETCVYNPYCGTCPVINLAMYGSIFTGKYEDYKCKIYKGMLDIIFEYIHMNDSDIMQIFKKWSN